MKSLALVIALSFVAAPALAQADLDPNQPANNGSAAASQTVSPGQVAPGVDPGTANANAVVQGNLVATDIVNQNREAQYAADLATYDTALARHGRQAARYARQRRAYADAMAAWRVQVAACQQGHQVACTMPAPDPASFY